MTKFSLNPRERNCDHFELRPVICKKKLLTNCASYKNSFHTDMIQLILLIQIDLLCLYCTARWLGSDYGRKSSPSLEGTQENPHSLSWCFHEEHFRILLIYWPLLHVSIKFRMQSIKLHCCLNAYQCTLDVPDSDWHTLIRFVKLFQVESAASHS